MPAFRSSPPSRPKVCPGSQLAVTDSPTRGRSAEFMFCSKAISSWPHGVATRYWVETPTKEASVITPGMALCPAGSSAPNRCNWSFSGRTPTMTRSDRVCILSVGTTSVWPNARTVTSSPRPTTSPGTRLDCPRKLAAKAVTGVS